MVIPEIRIELLAIAEWLDEYAEIDANQTLADKAARLRMIETELYRRKPVRLAPRSKKTPPVRLIRAFATQHPDMDYADMAAEIGVTTGRISEALVGKRT